MDRRTFLQYGSAGLIVGLAGCLVDVLDDDEPDKPSDADIPGWAAEVDFGDVDQEVYVEGRRYEFTPGTDEPVVVSAGDTIGFAYSSRDDGYHAGHGVGITELGIDLQTTVNGVEWTTFTPEQTGEFDMICTVPCSDNHYEMVGTLLVE